MDDLLRWRAEFPILENTVYMISHSLGAMPRRTRDRLNEFADTWAERGIRAWEEGWWDLPVTVGNLIGKIIGAGEGEVIVHQNVSVCQAQVLSCFDWSRGPRNKIVSEEMNFPTNLYLFEQAKRVGARLHFVPTDDNVTIPTERMIEAIDHDTALVACSHVLFRSSYLQDLAAIVKRANQVGAMVCADVYQSAGTVPLNVRELGLHFATGGSVKWLLGGPGAGYLYVRRDLWSRLSPGQTGWAAHKQPFAFDSHLDLADDMMRFSTGTPNVPALYSARSGYEIVHEVGVENIRAKSQRQTQKLIELAQEAGFRLNSPLDPARRGGVVVMDVPNGYEITKELARRNVLVDFRPGAGIRVAPHFYTTDDELEVTMKEIRTLAYQTA
jgi:kynureninase